MLRPYRPYKLPKGCFLSFFWQSNGAKKNPFIKRKLWHTKFGTDALPYKQTIVIEVPGTSCAKLWIPKGSWILIRKPASTRITFTEERVYLTSTSQSRLTSLRMFSRILQCQTKFDFPCQITWTTICESNSNINFWKPRGQFKPWFHPPQWGDSYILLVWTTGIQNPNGP